MATPNKIPGYCTVARALAVLTALTCMGSANAAEVRNFRLEIHKPRITFLVYDLPEFSGNLDDLKTVLKKALTYQESEPSIHASPEIGVVPAIPLRMKTGPKDASGNIGPLVPSCDGAIVTAAPSGDQVSRSHFKTSYLACVFPYTGGLRVNLYIADRFVGPAGVCKPGIGFINFLPNAACNPYGAYLDAFLDSATNQLEAAFKRNSWKSAIVEMNPVIAWKHLSVDELTKN